MENTPNFWFKGQNIFRECSSWLLFVQKETLLFREVLELQSRIQRAHLKCLYSKLTMTWASCHTSLEVSNLNLSVSFRPKTHVVSPIWALGWGLSALGYRGAKPQLLVIKIITIIIKERCLKWKKNKNPLNSFYQLSKQWKLFSRRAVALHP